jgi:preprotein translocase subunit SecB
MADNAAAGPEFIIQKLYVKDVSYEAPHAPDIFTRQQWQPEVNLQLENRSKAVSEDIYEDVLVVTVTVKQGEETAFLAEVHQAGLFTLKGFDEPTRARLLGVECLNVLFPYAREAISDVVTKGGFPPLLLAPVNFDQLYAEHQRKREQSAELSEGHA